MKFFVHWFSIAGFILPGRGRNGTFCQSDEDKGFCSAQNMRKFIFCSRINGQFLRRLALKLFFLRQCFVIYMLQRGSHARFVRVGQSPIPIRAGVQHYRILPDFFINSNFMMAANGTKVAPRTGWHWSCASTFCKNSWKTPNVEYYTLTKFGSAPKTVQDAYLKVLGKRKEDVNFKKQAICSMHWSCGKRLNLEDLPTVKFTEVGNQIRVPESQARALELLCYALH